MPITKDEDGTIIVEGKAARRRKIGPMAFFESTPADADRRPSARYGIWVPLAGTCN